MGARKIIVWRLVALITAVVVFIGVTVYGAVSLIGSRPKPAQTTPAAVSSEAAVQPIISDNEYVEKIKSTYSRTSKLETILKNIDVYPTTLLDALLRNSEIMDFVVEYTNHPQYGFENAKNIDISGDYTPGKIPLFIQWDARWGYEQYGTDIMALNACGPTCMAMIYVGLTGDTSENPLSVAELCIENHYYYAGQGTSTEMITYGARKLGLSSAQLMATPQTVLDSLNAGRPVLVNVGPGDFTTYGHYIVLTGVAENGEITVNDPNSPERSAKTWPLDRIIEQSYSIWSIWKA